MSLSTSQGTPDINIATPDIQVVTAVSTTVLTTLAVTMAVKALKDKTGS